MDLPVCCVQPGGSGGVGAPGMLGAFIVSRVVVQVEIEGRGHVGHQLSKVGFKLAERS